MGLFHTTCRNSYSWNFLGPLLKFTELALDCSSAFCYISQLRVIWVLTWKLDKHKVDEGLLCGLVFVTPAGCGWSLFITHDTDDDIEQYRPQNYFWVPCTLWVPARCHTMDYHASAWPTRRLSAHFTTLPSALDLPSFQIILLFETV